MICPENCSLFQNVLNPTISFFLHLLLKIERKWNLLLFTQVQVQMQLFQLLEVIEISQKFLVFEIIKNFEVLHLVFRRFKVVICRCRVEKWMVLIVLPWALDISTLHFNNLLHLALTPTLMQSFFYFILFVTDWQKVRVLGFRDILHSFSIWRVWYLE